MNEKKQGACGNSQKLIFACSGAADVGEIADRAARQLSREGAGKVYCLAGIGAGLNNFIEITKSSCDILAIDGCPVECAKKILERNGIKKFNYLRVTDLGMEKGKTGVTEEAIGKVICKSKELLQGVKE
jgi:uncharacterized metal-binding protein